MRNWPDTNQKDFDMCYKYPRTFHLDCSPGVQSDDKIFPDMSVLKKHRFVMTEKMDGENTTLYRDKMHARSLNYRHNYTRDLIRSYHALIKYDIPQGWRICGENLSYVHSIEYKELPHYFMVFSVWDSNNNCLSWEDTKSFCSDRGIYMVPEIGKDFTGTVEDTARLFMEYEKNKECEGFVLRNQDAFSYEDFGKNVFKWVRENHVQTDEHWLKNAIPQRYNKEI